MCITVWPTFLLPTTVLTIYQSFEKFTRNSHELAQRWNIRFNGSTDILHNRFVTLGLVKVLASHPLTSNSNEIEREKLIVIILAVKNRRRCFLWCSKKVAYEKYFLDLDQVNLSNISYYTQYVVSNNNNNTIYSISNIL